MLQCYSVTMLQSRCSGDENETETCKHWIYRYLLISLQPYEIVKTTTARFRYSMINGRCYSFWSKLNRISRYLWDVIYFMHFIVYGLRWNNNILSHSHTHSWLMHTFTHTPSHTDTFTHALTHIHTHIHQLTHMHSLTNSFAHTLTHIHTHIHQLMTCTHSQTSINTNTRIHITDTK